MGRLFKKCIVQLQVHAGLNDVYFANDVNSLHLAKQTDL